MTKDEALKKIKKCMAVANSNSPEEAAIALNQAQKLMAAYQVTERELSLIDVQEVKVKACSTAANAWEVRLARMVAEAFGCDFFGSLRGIYNAAGTWVRERHYVFVGIDAAPTIAGYAYEVLSRQCARDRLVHIRKQPKNCKPITKTARGDAFASGWVFAVSGLVDQFAQPERNEALLLAYIAEKHPELKDDKVRNAKARHSDVGHQIAGMVAGEKARLNHGVGDMPKRELLT